MLRQVREKPSERRAVGQQHRKVIQAEAPSARCRGRSWPLDENDEGTIALLSAKDGRGSVTLEHTKAQQ
jgi:hypothetical protein